MKNLRENGGGRGRGRLHILEMLGAEVKGSKVCYGQFGWGGFYREKVSLISFNHMISY